MRLLFVMNNDNIHTDGNYIYIFLIHIFFLNLSNFNFNII